MKIELTTIIVGFNHFYYLPSLLKSLEGNFGFSQEIIYVDNNSQDDSVRFIKNNYPRIKIIVNASNLGFAKALNMGLKKAKGEKFLILNPDIIIKRGALQKMIQFLNNNQKAACCVPRLSFPDGRRQYSCRRFPSVGTVLVRRTPLRFFLPQRVIESHLIKNLSNKSSSQIDWALGGCLMMRRATLDKVGYFDENFFLYGEDIDWFYRLKKAKLKAYYLPNAEIVHHHLAKSDKKLFSRESYYHLKSIFYFFKKYWKEIILNKGDLAN